MKKVEVGEIYWLKGISAFKHPHIVLEVFDEHFIAVKVTTNRKLLDIPGNIYLEEGKSGLQKGSIIDVSDRKEYKHEEVGDFIGILSSERLKEIRKSIEFIERSYF